MTILEEIISYKKTEVARARQKTPVARLEKSKSFVRDTLSMTRFLLDAEKTGIITEFKRKSPSRGIINAVSSIEEVTTGYFRCGASGLSILTDNRFFGGTHADLKRARQITALPILRKDFIIDEYQVIETRSMGADVLLLIAAALEKEQTKTLSRLAHSLQLQVLLEVHESAELDHLNEYIDIVGVNNRDLKTFAVDTERSVQLSAEIPREFVKISESGITSAITIKRLRGCGYQGFLIGESFMRAPSPEKAFADFIDLIMA
jgi:indole-3-glycerol phosphate synthase